VYLNTINNCTNERGNPQKCLTDKLYRNPPKTNPNMLAKPPKQPARPCTAPWNFDPARLESMDMKDGHMRPLPSANNITAPNTETRLFDANKTKFVHKIMLPIMTNFSSENFFNETTLLILQDILWVCQYYYCKIGTSNPASACTIFC
jgi:hypothetical protein